MQPPVHTPEFKRDQLIADGVEPAAAQSMSGSMSDRTFASTYDQQYRRQNPLDAATRRFDRFDKSPTRTLAPLYQDHVQPYVNKALSGTGAVLNSGYLPAGALGAGAGAGIGALLNLIRNQLQGTTGGYDTSASLGAAAGAGLGALSHHSRVGLLGKQASSQHRDPYTAVMLDASLSQSEKQSILQAMGRMSSRDSFELQRLLATVTGASVGALILRFLVGKGLVGTAIGAIVGGVIGRGMVPSHRLNSLNQYY